MLDYTDAIRNLKAAEGALLSQISQNTDGNYDAMSACLSFAKRIHMLADELELLNQEPELAHSASVAINHNAEFEEFPCYFIDGGSLYKIALKSDGQSGTYKKTVPIADVRTICNAVAKQLKLCEPLTTTAVQQSCEGIPPYRIQITIMALIDAGMLICSGRGKYRTATDAVLTAESLYSSLAHLSARPELIG